MGRSDSSLGLPEMVAAAPFGQLVVPYFQAHHPIELLVNVDHPEDHKAWAWASYNTSGLVVPVFSNNLHEVGPGAALTR